MSPWEKFCEKITKQIPTRMLFLKIDAKGNTDSQSNTPVKVGICIKLVAQQQG